MQSNECEADRLRKLFDDAGQGDNVRRAIQAETRRALIDDLRRCSRNDLPHQVDEMVRERIFSREGLSRMSAHAVVRETAAILATWLERGAP